MKQSLYFMFLFLLHSGTLSAQRSVDTAAIKKQLATIYERDQKTRAHGDSAEFIQYIDSTNLVQVEELIAQYGWLERSFFGAFSNYAIFLVIQHADLPIQEKYLPMLEQSVADSESRPCDLALLRDRILMRKGKKQVYGSQVVPDKTTGGWKFHPIEDEKNVNMRRKEMGLGPLEEYATHFGIEYKLPAQ